MADWLTLILTIFIAICLVIGSIYLLAYYSHPDDKNDCMALVAKIIAVFGLTLSFAMVLLLPLDVSNNRNEGDGFNMKVFWYLIFICSMVFIFILYPIVSGLYESDSDWTFCEKIRHALCCFITTIVFVIAISLILYFTIGKVRIENIKLI